MNRENRSRAMKLPKIFRKMQWKTKKNNLRTIKVSFRVEELSTSTIRLKIQQSTTLTSKTRLRYRARTRIIKMRSQGMIRWEKKLGRTSSSMLAKS